MSELYPDIIGSTVNIATAGGDYTQYGAANEGFVIGEGGTLNNGFVDGEGEIRFPGVITSGSITAGGALNIYNRTDNKPVLLKDITVDGGSLYAAPTSSAAVGARQAWLFIASGLTVNDGSVNTYRMIASNFEVNGGVVYNSTGSMYGGTINDGFVSGNALTISGIEMNGGTVYIGAYGKIYNLTLRGGTVSAKATAGTDMYRAYTISNAVISGGSIYLIGDAKVTGGWESRIYNDLTIYDGDAKLIGGHYTNLAISGGTVLIKTYDNSNPSEKLGTGTLSSGGYLSGAIELAAGAHVMVRDSGGQTETINSNWIDDTAANWNFNMAEVTVGGEAMIDYFAFSNAASYTITVTAGQEAGSYALAGNAASMAEKSFTVKTAQGENIGTVTVGGAALTTMYGTFALAVDTAASNTLTLTVTDAPPILYFLGGTAVGSSTEPVENIVIDGTSYDTMAIGNGGTATTTTVAAGGNLVVNAGTAAATTINGGSMVQNAGIANATTVSAGEFTLLGGEAAGVTVSAGAFNVNGGTAGTVNAIGGTTTIAAGIVDGITLNGGSVNFNGGTAKNVELTAGQTIAISNTVSGLTGTASLKNAAIISSEAVVRNADLDATVTSAVMVWSGADVDGITLDAAAIEAVSVRDKAVMNNVTANVTVGSGFVLYTGATLNDADLTVTKGQGVRMYGGTINGGTIRTAVDGIWANSTTVISNVVVSGGLRIVTGNVIDVDIYSNSTLGGCVYSQFGGHMDGTINVHSGAGVEITWASNGANRNSGTLNLIGGSLTVSDATNTNAVIGGTVNVYEGGVIRQAQTALHANGVINLKGGRIANATTAGSSLDLTSGSLNLDLAGVATGNSNAYVYSYDAITNNSGFACTVNVGSDAFGVYKLFANASTFARTVNLSIDGTVMKDDFGTSKSYTYHGVNYALSLSDTALLLTITPPAVLLRKGGKTLDGGSACTDQTIGETETYDQILVVSAIGTVTGTTVNAGGDLTLSAGTATTTTVNGGAMTLSAGTANATTVNGGTMNLIGGTANVLTLDGGTAIVTGGTANDVTVANGNFQQNAGVVSGLAIEGGSVTIAGGKTSAVTVAGGSVSVNDGYGSFTNITGGSVDINAGTYTINAKTAAATLTVAGGTVSVTGGTVDGVSINGGRVSAMVDGILTNATVDGGTVLMAERSKLRNITLRTGVISKGYNYYGASMSDSVISGGSIYLIGAWRGQSWWYTTYVNNTILGGTATLVGGRYTDLAISGGAVTLMTDDNSTPTGEKYVGTESSGTYLSGTIELASAANVHVTYGGTLTEINDNWIDDSSANWNFNLTEVAAGNTAMIDYFAFSDAASYTVTVNADQAVGTYSLAGNASQMAGESITVKSAEGTTLATVTVGAGGKLTSDYVYFAALTGDNTLTFSIEAIQPVMLLKNGNVITQQTSFADVTIDGTTYDEMTVAEGGTVTNTTVTDGVIQLGGGTADATTVNGGTLNQQGGIADTVTITTGEFDLQGGTANGVNANGGTTLITGETATTLTSIDGAYVGISEDGFVSGLALNGGQVGISGGSVYDLEIAEGQKTISSIQHAVLSGVSGAATVSGALWIGGDVTAYNINLNPTAGYGVKIYGDGFGSAYVSGLSGTATAANAFCIDNAYVENVDIAVAGSNNRAFDFEGGTIVGGTISAGNQAFYAKGTTSDVTIYGSARLVNGIFKDVDFYYDATNEIIGGFHYCYGGRLEGTATFHENTLFYVEMLNETTVNAIAGTANFLNGAGLDADVTGGTIAITGTANVYAGAYVNQHKTAILVSCGTVNLLGGTLSNNTNGGLIFADGAALNLNLAGVATGNDTAYVTSYDAITGKDAFTCTINVDSTAIGQYKLFGYASDFDRTVNLSVDGAVVESEFSLTKSYTTSTGTTYALSLVDNALYLTISEAPVRLYKGETVAAYGVSLADQTIDGTTYDRMLVSDGGTVTNTTVNGTGEVNVTGGTVTTITVSAGTFTQNGGTVTGLTAEGGVATIADGTATTIAVSAGTFTQNGGTATTVTLTGGTTTLTDGTVNGLDVNGGTALLTGGTANDVTLGGGEFHLANDAVTLTGGTLFDVEFADEAVNFNDGIIDGAAVTDGSVNFNGGVANGLTATGGTTTIAGGIVSNVSLNGGEANFDGGIVIGAELAEGQAVAIRNTVSGLSGTASGANAVVISKGAVVSGLSATATGAKGAILNSGTVNGGVLDLKNTSAFKMGAGGVFNGGTITGVIDGFYANTGDISDVTISGGGIRAVGVSITGANVYANATSRGQLGLHNGATVYGTVNVYSSASIDYDYAQGGYISGTVNLFSGASMLLYPDKVGYLGGIINVDEGAKIIQQKKDKKETNLVASGIINLKGGYLQNSTEGGTICFTGGSSELNFDLSGIASGNTSAYVTSYDALTGETFSCTVNVDSSATGEYKLFGNASSFSAKRTISLSVDDTEVSSTFGIGSTYQNDATCRKYTLTRNSSNEIVLSITAACGEEAESTGDAAPIIGGGTALAGTTWGSTTEYSTGGMKYVGNENVDQTNLVIDNNGGTAAMGTYAFGGGTGTAKGSARVELFQGAIGAVMGGAAAGGSVKAAEVIVGGGTTTATTTQVFGGGHGNVEGDISVTTSKGAVVTDKLYGGPMVKKGVETDTTVGGDIDVELQGGTLNSDVMGGARVMCNGSATTTVAGSATVHVSGVTLAGGTGACIYGGGWIVGGTATRSEGYDYSVKGVVIDVDSDVAIGTAAGRGIFGGALAASFAMAKVDGDVNITVDNASVGNVFGGGWAQSGAQSDIDGDVNITLTNAKMSSGAVYGGGAHGAVTTGYGTTSVSGNVSITINGGTVRSVYAVGQAVGDNVTGDATVTLQNNATLSVVSGTRFDGSDGNTGTSTLVLDGFTGTINSALRGFDSISVDNETAFTLASGAEVVGTTWNFAMVGRDEETAALTWNSDGFEADTIFKLTIGDTATDWTVCNVFSDALDEDATPFDDVTFQLSTNGTEFTDYTLGSDINTGAWSGKMLAYDKESGTLAFKDYATIA